MINEVKEIINELNKDLTNLNEYLYHNPELGYQEYKACKAHMELLRKNHFSIIEEYIGIQTAFKAEFDSGTPGPKIAYLSEYDALPKIGHGCGHNILGTTSTGAGIVLSKFISKLGGKVIVFGTPAEEVGGAKVDLVNNGAFDDIDIVMIAHASNKYYKSGESLAMEAIQFTFKGKSAHAAGSPEKGINALDAVISTFNNINALREHVKSSARIHGIISEGGKAANIVPDLAIAQFYVRADSKLYLKELVKRINNCAKGAALATGADLEISNYEASYDNLITNKCLSDSFTKRLYDMGVDKVHEPKESYGSSDAGNVSHVCPTIHPYFSLGNEDIVGHTQEFADATISESAYKEMNKTIGALVLTAIDVIKDKELLSEIKKEFEDKGIK